MDEPTVFVCQMEPADTLSVKGIGRRVVVHAKRKDGPGVLLFLTPEDILRFAAEALKAADAVAERETI